MTPLQLQSGLKSQSRSKSQSGFTLVEVLVALVFTALLVTIIMDGAVTAKTRANNQQLQMEALVLARAHIADLRSEAGEPSILTGKSKKIIWALEEQEIARDPRGIFVLVEANISAGPKDKPKLAALQKRYLKRLLVQ